MGKSLLRRRTETLPVLRAYGRVSASELTAHANAPPFPSSHMDGFAVVSKDLEAATDSRPVMLKIVGEAGPGARPKHHLRNGEAFQVATGAYLPEGSDAVVPREFAEVRDGSVLSRLAPRPGDHVYGAGEDIREGQVVLSKGQPIRAQDVGLMIALGFKMLSVWGRPKVSVIATGSELTSSDKPQAGKVRESHTPIFMRLLEASGCTPIDLGIVGDEAVVLRRALRRGLLASDSVITLGGTSAGRRDYVVEAVSALSPSVLFHGIKLDRGRVTAVACVGGKPVLMLPGPIQAAMNAFLVLGAPIFGQLTGRGGLGLELPCTLGKDWESRKKFAEFRKVVYVKLVFGEEVIAEPLAGETESLKLLQEADGYMVVAEDITRLAAGSHVKVRFFPGFSYVP